MLTKANIFVTKTGGDFRKAKKHSTTFSAIPFLSLSLKVDL